MRIRERLKLALAILRGDDDALWDYVKAEIAKERRERQLQEPQSWFGQTKRLQFERRPSSRELNEPCPGEIPAASWKYGQNWAH